MNIATETHIVLLTLLGGGIAAFLFGLFWPRLRAAFARKGR